MGTSEKELLHSYAGHSLLQSISSGLDEDDDAYNRIEQSPAPLSNKPNRQTDRQIQVRGQVSKFPHEPTETSSTTTRGHTQAVADQCPVRTTMGCSQLRRSSPYKLSLAHLASSSSEIPGQDCLGPWACAGPSSSARSGFPSSGPIPYPSPYLSHHVLVLVFRHQANETFTISTLPLRASGLSNLFLI